jgi:hypothetical protein
LHLWLDDERPPPQGWEWEWAKTAGEAMLLASRVIQVHEMSLDHDLGPASAGNGMDFVNWLIKTARWPAERPDVHSQNRPRAHEMRLLIAERGPYDLHGFYVKPKPARHVAHAGFYRMHQTDRLGTHATCPDPACCHCWCPGCVVDWKAAGRPGPQHCTILT